MTLATAYAVAAPDGRFEKTTVERRKLGPDDVLIDVKFAGICHSDIHTARNEWQGTSYPCVPGHEIAGIVAAVGSHVTGFAVGDRVGVGCLVDSCGECENCLVGSQQYCSRGATWTYNHKVPEAVQDGGITMGGYSTQIVVTQGFVVSIPDGIALEQAAPLLCAGITLFSPLRHWNAGPGKRVAIIGMGGLGHIGVKIAAALGAEVTVLSQSLSKQDDGLRFGAHHYFATADETTFRTLRGHFDLIINTVSAELPMTKYISLLKLDGTLVVVGMPPEPMLIPAPSLIGARRSVAGSLIGGLPQTQEMLNFCADHGIGAEIEVIAADRIDEAYDRVLRSDIRYRFVIDTATF